LYILNSQIWSFYS